MPFFKAILALLRGFDRLKVLPYYPTFFKGSQGIPIVSHFAN